MSSESLVPQFDQQFPTTAIPQAPAESKPRKRLRSIIKHERRNSIAQQYAEARREKNTKVFEQVLQTYVEIASLSPLGACSLDPTARRNGLTYLHVEWIVDVDHTVKSVLSPYLLRKWQSLLSIEFHVLNDHQRITALTEAGITLEVMRRLTQKLGQVFYARELQPGRYFTRIRRRNRFEKVREQEIRCAEAVAPVEANENVLSAAQVQRSADVQQSADFDASDFGSGYSFGRIEPDNYE